MKRVSIVITEDVKHLEDAINERLQELQDNGNIVLNVSKPEQLGEKNYNGSNVIVTVIMYATRKRQER